MNRRKFLKSIPAAVLVTAFFCGTNWSKKSKKGFVGWKTELKAVDVNGNIERIVSRFIEEDMKGRKDTERVLSKIIEETING